MPTTLVTYLTQRIDASTFLLPADLERTLDDLFQRAEQILPQPYKIFSTDETQPPVLGFPILETTIMKDLDARLDRWLTDEVQFQVTRSADSKDKVQVSFAAYIAQLMKVAENAMTSNLLSDYHAVFWLAHSVDIARHFASIPRRVSATDAAVGRTQGDAIKYRIFAKWSTDTREQMTQIASKSASILDGDEQRALQFFRLLQDDVLILTEEFVGPDLRELRSFVNGYVRRDFQAFRDALERLRTTAADLVQHEHTLRATLPLFGANPEQGVTIALLLDARFQNFIFDHPSIQNVLSREDREQFQLIGRRVREFAVLNQLRRGIVWMANAPDGTIVAADRRNDVTYSRSTRPLDFGRPGVVDPIIHRFGLIYDISAFTETLGAVRRGGGKEEVKAYRQMLLFQRRMETIADRHRLKFEKFLGDGAFYTTRRALGLTRAAVEIQRFYSEMKRKKFAFNKGLRIALNYGYYRLLPMKGSNDAERITEFYGPGIVELSRLTTGKANKEIDEIAAFLVAKGFDPEKVQKFFAPLQHGDDVIDHQQHEREYYAYVNTNGTLMNEGIVASYPFLQELSNELQSEVAHLYRIKQPWGSYIGFLPAVGGVEFIGLRLLGMVQLKGLENIDVGEIVPFSAGEAEAEPVDSTEPLLTLLRQEYHAERSGGSFLKTMERMVSTAEHLIGNELVICVPPEGRADDVVIGEWDPRSDDVMRPLRLPRGDFQKLFQLKGDQQNDMMRLDRTTVRDLYDRLADDYAAPAFHLSEYRNSYHYETYVVGEVIEKL